MKPADGADYRAQLEQVLTESSVLAQTTAIIIPNCPDLTYTSRGYREISDIDGISSNFYTTEFKKPGILELIQVAGCEKAFTTSVTVVARKAGQLRISVVFFGDTRAGLLLQRDASLMAFAFVDTAYRESHNSALCAAPAPVVVNRRIANAPPGDAWSEVWTTSFCGALYRTNVSFSPNLTGPGTQFNVKLLPDSPSS